MPALPKTNNIIVLVLCAMLFGMRMMTPVFADEPDLLVLQEREKEPEFGDEETMQETDLEKQIRRDAQREAALSYGARGGLAWRTRDVMETLHSQAVSLDKTYNFRRLLITAPSNMLIEPPIIAESLDAFHVSDSGDEAAVSDVIYNISKQAKIVAAPRDWRQYLDRTWDDDIAPPPNILLPENAKERQRWRRWVEQGWEEGILQADEIFQADLNRLIMDFEGMIRYRMLLAEGKVSSPYAVLEERGVTGGGDEMRIGDRAIRISGPAELRTAGDTWTPATR